MKNIYLSFCFLLVASALHAQVTIGRKLGLNVNCESCQFSGGYAGTGVKSREATVRYQACVAINLKTSNHFSVRPEVLFNVMVGNTSFGDNNSNTRTLKNTYNYLSVPLNFVATFPAGPGNIYVFVALQISVGLGGKYLLNVDSSSFFVSTQYAKSGTLQTSNMPSNKNGDTRYFNQMSWSINYGIGYKLKGLLFTGQYHIGLTNTQPHYSDVNKKSLINDVVSKNYSFTIGLTYFFGDIKHE